MEEIIDVIKGVFYEMPREALFQVGLKELQEKVLEGILEEEIYQGAEKYLNVNDRWHESLKMLEELGYKLADALNLELLATVHYQHTLLEAFSDLDLENGSDLGNLIHGEYTLKDYNPDFGVTIIHLDEGGEVYCASCAMSLYNDNLAITTKHTYLRGPELKCTGGCGTFIPSDYGESE